MFSCQALLTPVFFGSSCALSAGGPQVCGVIPELDGRLGNGMAWDCSWM